MQKVKSLKLNMVLNAIKGLLGIIFPLITFPYVTRVLGVDNVGKFNFSYSVVSYFVLFATLGIKTYGVREGARLRESKEQFTAFANEIFSINIYSTIASYLLLAVIIFTVPKVQAYYLTIFILSGQILFSTIGVEWIYTVYEDYLYITLRGIFIYIASLVMLIAFVRDQNDINIYAFITVIANGGANIYNFFYAKKYCKLKLVRKNDLKLHIPPIMTFFATSLAITVYTNSDITILGFLWDDNVVGIYSVSCKIYNTLKILLSSVIIVSIPRLSNYVGKHEMKKYENTIADIYYTLLTVTIPAVVGIILLRKEIILIISGEAYLESTVSLILLSIAALFSLGAWFWGQCVLVPQNKEKFVFKITVWSALINIILNILFIPCGKEIAAAFTTVIAELFAFITQYYEGRKYAVIEIGKLGLKIGIGCIFITIIVLTLGFLKEHFIVFTIIASCSAIVGYGLVEILLQNPASTSIMNIIKKKFCGEKQ